MSDVLIRGLSMKAVNGLKDRARRNGRSLQGEAKTILEQAAGTGSKEVARMLGAWKKRFAGRRFSSSVKIIRKDREQ
jgi:plasmid stability protein